MNIPTLEDSVRKFFTIEYFITRITQIPDAWATDTFTNPNRPEQHCVFGHLGCTFENQENEEANALDRLFREHGLVAIMVNDGKAKGFPQPTPKARILAALESFK